jgi:hypothetical protein
MVTRLFILVQFSKSSDEEEIKRKGKVEEKSRG